MIVTLKKFNRLDFKGKILYQIINQINLLGFNFDKLFKVSLILIKNLFSKKYYDFLNHFRDLFTNFNFYFVRFDLFLFLKLYLPKSVFLFFWKYKDHNYFDFSLLKILNDLAKN